MACRARHRARPPRAQPRPVPRSLPITSPEQTIPLCQGIGADANRSGRPGYPAGNGATGTGAARPGPGARPARRLPPVADDPGRTSGTACGTGLLTDHYELTMLAGAMRSGVAARRAVFEVFARHLPHGRRYGVVAGTGRLLDALKEFRFGPDDI